MMSLNTNAQALTALESLNKAAGQMEQTERRVSTGLAIATPEDNGAVWAIAQNMRSQAAAWQAVATGLNRAQSIVEVASAAAGSISGALTSLKAAVLALNDPSLDAASQNVYRQTIQQLLTQVDQAADSATFDGVNLLAPVAQPPVSLAAPSGPTPNLSVSAAMTGQPGQINLQGTFFNVSPSAGGGPSMTISGVAPSQDGTYGFAVGGAPNSISPFSMSFQYGDLSNFSAVNPASVDLNFSTTHYQGPSLASYGVSIQSLTLTTYRTHETVAASPDGSTDTLYYRPMTSQFLGLSNLMALTPDAMLAAVNNAISQVIDNSSRLGAQQTMFQAQAAQAATMQDTIETGVGNLVNADLAKESAKLQASQVKQQLAVQALSIASGAPNMLLNLFK